MPFAPRPSRPLTTGRRAGSRLRIRLPARLTLLSGEFSVLLVNLSEEGAGIRFTRPIAMRVGGNAVLTWHSFEVFAEIRRVDPDGCGLLFEEPLSRSDLLLTRTLDATTRPPSERELQRDYARRWADGHV